MRARHDASVLPRDGLPLGLGAGMVDLSGLCPAIEARGGFSRPGNHWSGVRARWQRCTGPRRVLLRARFAFDAPFCTRLTGRLRLGARRFRVVADRVPACGNGLREPGEQCDGVDSASQGQCCNPDCTVKAGCSVLCDEYFPCGPADVCVSYCSSVSACEPRQALACGGGPVCGCDGTTTYPDRCAAFDAGTGVQYFGGCQPPPSDPPTYR